MRIVARLQICVVAALALTERASCGTGMNPSMGPSDATSCRVRSRKRPSLSEPMLKVAALCNALFVMRLQRASKIRHASARVVQRTAQVGACGLQRPVWQDRTRQDVASEASMDGFTAVRPDGSLKPAGIATSQRTNNYAR